MGEARIRRRAGLPPRERLAPTPVGDFRVEAGQLAVTLDIADADLSTVVLEPQATFAALAEIDAEMARDALPYAVIVTSVAQQFRRARRRRDDAALPGIALGAAWLALNHPKFGQQMSAGVSAAMRRHNRAHITWRVRKNGVAFALSDRFVDLAQAVAIVPDNEQSVVIRDDGDDDVVLQ